MPFTLRITFTGILAFVPDKAFGTPPNIVYVLAPDGEVIDPTDPPTGADGRKLSRHRSFLRLSSKNVEGTSGAPSSLESLWYLGGREIRIQKTGGDDKIKIGDLTGLATLVDVAPMFCTVDPNAVKGAPSSLGMRFAITAGTLSCGKRQGKWAFPNILSKKPVLVQDMSNEVILTLTGLQSATIMAKPLSGGDEVPLKLTPGEESIIDVTIGNLCDVNPLEWLDLYDRKPDEDFRWYFELLSPVDYANLETLVEGIPLPFPYPVGKVNAQGADCFTVSFAPLG